jgi:hypothetical protein
MGDRTAVFISGTYYTQNGKVYLFFASAFKQFNSLDSTIALLLVKHHEYRQTTF